MNGSKSVDLTVLQEGNMKDSVVFVSESKEILDKFSQKGYECRVSSCVEETVDDILVEESKKLVKKLVCVVVEEETEIDKILSYIRKNVIVSNLGSICCLVEEGYTLIKLPTSCVTGVGLLPRGKSIISSRGLKWELDKFEVSFSANMLSTSNQSLSEEISLVVEGNELNLTFAFHL